MATNKEKSKKKGKVLLYLGGGALLIFGLKKFLGKKGKGEITPVAEQTADSLVQKETEENPGGGSSSISSGRGVVLQNENSEIPTMPTGKDNVDFNQIRPKQIMIVAPNRPKYNSSNTMTRPPKKNTTSVHLMPVIKPIKKITVKRGK